MGASDSKETAPPDTVVLHTGLKRGPNAPSFIPYALKLETYFRMAKIPYQHTDKGGMGPKCKVPWIEYNGEQVGDSYFIIKYLNKQFNVDLDRNLSPEEKAMSTSLRIMTEEFLQYSIDLELIVWNDKENIKKLLDVATPVVWFFRSKISGDAKTQGIGSHSREEVHQLTEEQLSAISTVLGDKPYLMGKEPTEVDCTMMGVLGQIKWHMEGSFHYKLIEEKFPNISHYLDRIKMNFYPDWDQLIASSDKTDKHTDATKSNGVVDETKIPIEVK